MMWAGEASKSLGQDLSQHRVAWVGRGAQAKTFMYLLLVLA